MSRVSPPYVPAIVLTGLPRSGKTTLGSELVRRLRRAETAAHLLDGDELRARLPPRLGFSRPDRSAASRRACFLAEVLQLHGIVPVLALVLPFEEDRRRVRKALGPACVLVALHAPLRVLLDRDDGGLYAAVRASGDIEYRAILDVYDPPVDALRIDTATVTVGEAADAVQADLERLGPARLTAARPFRTPDPR